MIASKLGQNFLIDQNIGRKIVASIPLNQEYIEIGPGYGALTYHFLNTNLTCLEIDKKIPQIDNVNWIYINALKYPFKKEQYIFSNLPYSIATQIMQICATVHVAGWTFMMQKEVADRVLASAGKEYGRLSLLMQSQFTISKLFDVSPNCFFPKPQVWSTVLQGVRKNSECCPMQLETISRIIFQHRRKCLNNIQNSRILNIIRELNIDTKLRPENIKSNDFWKIVNAF